MPNFVIMLDKNILAFLVKHTEKISRLSLFIVYFWFGILKVLGASPATNLVHALFDKTISGFIEFDLFYILFSLFEVVIGILFLFPKLTKLSFYLFFLHIFSTILPLFLLGTETWSGVFVPTLEGQYILKNLILISLVITLYIGQSKNSKK